MRPRTTPVLSVRNAAFGGPTPLVCVPLVAASVGDLVAQATFAHTLTPDVVEWRADAFEDQSPDAILAGLKPLRDALPTEALIFTLRAQAEGGMRPLSQERRRDVIEAVIRSGHADIIDIELRNGPGFVEPVVASARAHGVRVILSFHDFQKTPANDVLRDAIAAMVRQGADIAKVACMPTDAHDVLRVLDVTLAARQAFPSTPLCTMSMGRLGVLTRVAGFLYGSDMSFAVGQTASAPGQIPIAELRRLMDALGQHA